jgi:large subunit ribosomal protein L16
MLLIPKKQKYKKLQKGKSFNKIKPQNNHLVYGQIGLKVLTSSRVKSKQLVAIYNNIKKKIKKRGKVILTTFPQTPVTKKPTEIRMGKGKGGVSFWASKISAGSVICEISTFYTSLAVSILKKIRFKISPKTKLIYRK